MRLVSTLAHEKCLWPSLQDGTRIPCGYSQPLPKMCLVNARHMKNVPGRRTDWHECQWLQFLHSVGLLTGCLSAWAGRLRRADHMEPPRNRFVKGPWVVLRSFQRQLKLSSLLRVKLFNFSSGRDSACQTMWPCFGRGHCNDGGSRITTNSTRVQIACLFESWESGNGGS